MRSSSKGRRSVTSRKRSILSFEVLEDRSLMSVYTPAQIAHAYGFDQIGLDGTGQTIAIVDAYDAPKIFYDTQTFQNSPLGMNKPSVDVTGFLSVGYAQGSKPAYNSGWSQEATLDVQWAHAMAPGAKILLVETASNSFADLFAGVDYAVAQGASVVSMSWGSGEFSGESTYDSHFNVPGVSFVASSGDSGAVVSYPAASPYVLSVGGTSLNAIGPPPSESAWNSSGGGVSAVESKPDYQNGVAGSKRSTPDVAYNANPNTGVYVHWTSATSTTGGWYSFGGTSAGAPQWAALVAVANQGRADAGAGPIDGDTELLPALYANPGDFNDITSGKAGVGRRANSAGPGYDLATGLGTPNAAAVVAHLVTATPAAAPSGNTGTQTGGHGSHHVVTVSQGSADAADGTQAAIVAAFNTRGAGFVIAPVDTISVISRSDPAARLPETTNQTVSVLLAMGSASDNSDEEILSSEVVGFGTPDAPDYFAAPIDWMTVRNDGDQEAINRVEYESATDEHTSTRAGASAPAAANVVVSDVEAGSPNVVARTVGKVFWLVAAAIFFAQGCAFARAREIAAEEEENKRRAAV